jgi:hypothetical protein
MTDQNRVFTVSHPDEMNMTWQSGLDIVARAGLPPADQARLLAMPYPVKYDTFWQVLAGMGMTQGRLMDRMGASP